MSTYDVNVRARIHVSYTDKYAIQEIPGWNIYNVHDIPREHEDDAFKSIISCDQNVVVEADSEEDAIKLAKENTTEIVIDDCDVDELKIWVDAGIDVELRQPRNKM